ncbi:tail protein [Sphaerisporangium siamense]|uniref:Phage tail sheath protein FI n=1 Tax=Sphaerisporangium siamense TaxID=795645 RepID=A0A7W7G7F4_9ACTN|nr:phage tail sheath C-terminal domain-containing protein [Sphaerisporangium siamense]MBB4700553.1 phage tail sheath protein FI [Sphaerisporangium siamense]GII88917.1 tail protein [Sphaerisporangium siamense]
MPVTPTYPGVYIEELPSTVRTITGVSTSVTAFVGYTPRGPVNTPVTLTGFADYERRFGGLAASSLLSYAVRQFFLKGGATAIVVRLASGAASASAVIPGAGDGGSLTVSAREQGAWADSLRVAIDPAGEGAFDLRVFGPSGAVRETYAGLSLDPESPRFAESVVGQSSGMVTLKVTGTAFPAYSGTVSAPIGLPLPDVAGQEITATAGGESHTFTLYDENSPDKPRTLPQLALLLERRIRAAAPTDRAFSAARVHVRGDRLHVLAGDPGAALNLTGATALNLASSVRPPSFPFSGGGDGSPPGAADFIGSPDAKTGIHALRDVEDVNLLVLPELAGEAFDDTRIDVIAQAVALCEEKRIFLLLDAPRSWSTLDRARSGLAEFDSVRSDHAALYFPHIRVTDPLTGRLRDLPPSGAVAGVYARTDVDRGVWKAPAGTEATLPGVRAFNVPLTDPENGLINVLALNALRAFPVIGPVVWGARTLAGADRVSSPWKYVPVRRLALFLEESLYRGTKWVVFEPNDERLWSQIRLNVGAFLHTLFLRGAFQGTSPREAYFVRCDASTTTQDDVNRGVVNVVVGFAPLKPAEFVIVQIEQMAGRLQV